ncbi:phosphoribosylanthranilate isomerase [Lichenibacterium dinghuense]|uniref:phosphoribosylanthranilate isomerase n=1 Tax=Lichenibacterium dinghuense TaxID=2895977 RepID=UPI001F012A30|nr:phosphoribosylanthranilate isomerase [Lichenibacterium sp. 6Y81]
MAPLIKICGLSTEDTLDAALDAGAGRVGLVFFPRSPRHLAIRRAAALAARARGRAAVVALTVDADDGTLDEIVAAVGPDMLQLHGRETSERVAGVRARFGRPVVKVLGVSEASDVSQAPAWAEVADEVMFDAKPPKGATRPGGNGVAFDWSLLAGLDLPVPFMLSGGLGPHNVGEALRATRAPAVDVSSGVETAPGVKSPELIAAFVRAARGTPPDEDLSP